MSILSTQFFDWDKNQLTGTVVVGTEFKTGVAVAFVGTERVDAGAIVTDVGIALTFVDVDTRITAGRQSIAAAADALERALEVVTFSIVANTRTIATLVDIFEKN